MEFPLSSIDSLHDQLLKDSDDIDLDVFRKIISICHHKECNDKSDPVCKIPDSSEMSYSAIKVSETLMNHIKSGFKTVDGQTLCSTAYCAVFALLSEEFCEISLRNLHTSLLCYLLQQKCKIENKLISTIALMENEEDRKIETKISLLISGIFQTNLLNKSFLSEFSKIRQLSDDILLTSYQITVRGCSIYSCCTCTHFRNLYSILTKIIEWNFLHLLNDEMKNLLLHIIFNNWENLMPGVRESNLKIWSKFIQLANKNNSNNRHLLYEITANIMKFPWNKAKYFALCEIVSNWNYGVIDFINKYPLCVNGLEYSLRHPSLVSHGSDLYKNILQELKCYEDWSTLFLDLFNSILKSEEQILQANILNRWIPITLKKYPLLIINLIETLVNISSDGNLFVKLSLLKLGRKSGLVLTDWNKDDFKDIIEKGLIHVDEDIRSQAFQIICFTQKNNIPSEEEFKIFKEYLICNINNDSAPFRQNNLNCFITFLIRICDSCMKILKTGKKLIDEKLNKDLDHTVEFFVWIYNFILQNLEGFGNYQRKILSLQIFDVILQYLSGENKAKKNLLSSSYKKRNQQQNRWILLEYLESKNKWFFNNPKNIRMLIKCINDTTNDIRETATNILIQYYGNNETLIKSKQELFINGIILCNSALFYEVESGCLMFKILAHLLREPLSVDDSVETIIKPSNNIPEYLLKKAWEQFTDQESDLLFSVNNNQPLHGMVSSLNMFIKNSKSNLKDCFFTTLKNFLSTVVNYFINILASKSKSNSSEYPPSFAEMGESVESLVASSMFKHNRHQENDQKLSNAHQLILNNIWLNLKACCELSSTILVKHLDQVKEDDIKDLLYISISVLTRCRHKGAIESAGVSLGQSVKHLTSIGNSNYNQMISVLLRDFLVQSTSESIHGGSITRRSAGLTILVHRLVSNDSAHGKPLFYLTMDLLIHILSKPEKKTSHCLNEKLSEVKTEIVANERDIPLARALHLLCRTVCESSLASYVVQYAPQLATVCFHHLSSEQWQIRNAALQLYGALVPKMIGQRKSQSEQISLEAPVPPDELFSHIPSLWVFIRKELMAACDEQVSANILLAHSNIVPLLGLLSSTAKRYMVGEIYSEAFIGSDIKVADIEEFFPYLINLLGSPIFTVRTICAKTVELYFDVVFFCNHWEVRKQSSFKENELHGYLLTFKNYISYYKNSNKYLLDSVQKENIEVRLKNVLEDFNNIIIIKKSSFLVKSLYFTTTKLLEPTYQVEYCKILEEHLESEKVKLQTGYPYWYQLNLIDAILNCTESDLVVIVENCLNNTSAILEDNFWIGLKDRVTQTISVKQEILEKMVKIFFNFLKIENKKNVLKYIYELLYIIVSNNSSIILIIDLDTLYAQLNFDNNVEVYKYDLGYLLPLISFIACEKNTWNYHLKLILQLVNICKALSNPENFEAENRLMSAISIQHLKIVLDLCLKETIISEAMNTIKSNFLITCIKLLQDEDYDVRISCAKMCLYYPKDTKAFTHPTYQLHIIFYSDFLLHVFGNQDHVITFLKLVLTELSTAVNKKENNDLQNPFAHQTSNIYWEPLLIQKNILNLITYFSNFKG